MASKEEVLERIHRAGVISIFRVEAPEGCIPAMDALVEGGLKVFEVTITTPGAVEVISEARKKYGSDAIVGAGTVIDRAGAEQVASAGAQFIISPSLDRDVVEFCTSKGIVSCPGTFTATEIVQAWKWGADLIKVFPISQVGPGYIKAIRAPLPQARLVPTGGIDASNLGDYLAAGAFAVGIGGGLVPARAIAEGRYGEITKAAAAVVEAVNMGRKP